VAVLRYWAGARAAAGVESERVDALTLAEALDAARAGRDASFGRVLDVCSFVVDEHPVGRTPPAEVALDPEAVVEVLPPFAGGSGGAGGAGSASGQGWPASGMIAS
jgi:molybdopterin synthase sulfur carrier subunit